MNISILCKDEDLATVKITANNEYILYRGLSVDGKLPITHWYCFLMVTQEAYDGYMALQDLTIIEQLNPKPFLEKHNLRMVTREHKRVPNNKWS